MNVNLLSGTFEICDFTANLIRFLHIKTGDYKRFQDIKGDLENNHISSYMHSCLNIN